MRLMADQGPECRFRRSDISRQMLNAKSAKADAPAGKMTVGASPLFTAVGGPVLSQSGRPSIVSLALSLRDDEYYVLASSSFLAGLCLRSAMDQRPDRLPGVPPAVSGTPD
jgi:hypothetical protein